MSQLESPSRTLRRAAVLVRERAAAATRGPWWAEEDESCWQLRGVAISRQILKAPKRGTPYAEYWPEEADAAWITSMSPLVGFAIADCLDIMATQYEQHSHAPASTAHIIPALTLARTLIGEYGADELDAIDQVTAHISGAEVESHLQAVMHTARSRGTGEEIILTGIAMASGEHVGLSWRLGVPVPVADQAGTVIGGALLSLNENDDLVAECHLQAPGMTADEIASVYRSLAVTRDMMRVLGIILCQHVNPSRPVLSVDAVPHRKEGT